MKNRPFLDYLVTQGMEPTNGLVLNGSFGSDLSTHKWSGHIRSGRTSYAVTNSPAGPLVLT